MGIYVVYSLVDTHLDKQLCFQEIKTDQSMIRVFSDNLQNLEVLVWAQHIMVPLIWAQHMMEASTINSVASWNCFILEPTSIS